MCCLFGFADYGHKLTRKLRLRLLLLYLEVVFRGLLSPKRRKSAIFRRIRAFVQHALF